MFAQGVNRFGGAFRCGVPLPNAVRKRMIEMYELGVRPCEISRQLKVSHGCVSRLLSKYNDTGSFQPGPAKKKTLQDVSSEVIRKIEEYRYTFPDIFSWEVRAKLLADGLCTKESLPPSALISCLLRRKATPSNKHETEEVKDDEDEGSNCAIKNQRKTPLSNSSHAKQETGIEENCMYDIVQAGPSITTKSQHTKVFYRRRRTRFTEQQISEMERAFKRIKYPDVLTREELSERLKISESKVQVWFANRRSREKRTQVHEKNSRNFSSPISKCNIKPCMSRIIYPSPPALLLSPQGHIYPTHLWEDVSPVKANACY